jgi:hypothetical protein
MKNQNRVSTSKEAPASLRFLAAILAIVFVLVALVSMIGFDVWQVLSNPPLVKQVLTQEVISSDIVPVILQIFSEQRAAERVSKEEALSGVNEPDIVLLISFINADGWRKIKQLLLTDAFLTDLVSVSVDSIYAWIDSNDPQPKFVWDLTSPKARLAGEEGPRAIQVAYAALPVCTQVEIDDFQKRLAQVPQGTEVLYNLCQFPVPWQEDQVSDYLSSLLVVNQNIPTRFDSGALLSQNSSSDPAAAALKSQLRLIRSIAQWGWLVAAGLLVLILALAVRSRHSLGQFIGIPLAISGGITLAISAVLMLLIVWGGQADLASLSSARWIEQTSSGLLRAEIERSLLRLAAELFQPLLTQGFNFAVVGALMIILTIIKDPKKA